MSQYNNLSDHQKKQILLKEYEQNKKSFKDIADEYSTYPNKLRRDAIKYNLKIRDKKEAQKNALSTGRIKHPTKGKKRPDSVKQKIGLSVLESWEKLDSNEIEERKNKARINWEKKTDDEKSNILKQANDAVRQSSKTGSKLEKFLFAKLLALGYAVEFHKEQSILNTKLQIDLFVPTLNTAIEVDGPSHFEPVWGDDALTRNKKYDNKKTGLIIGKGLFLIRIKQSKDFSKSRGLIILNQLLEALNDIQNNKVANNKVINIGD